MKIVAKPIKVLVVFEPKDKPPMPYKFKMEDSSGELITVTVDQLISTVKSKIVGEECFIYECQSIIRGVEKRYQLKYIIPKCQWVLYKI